MKFKGFRYFIFLACLLVTATLQAKTGFITASVTIGEVAEATTSLDETEEEDQFLLEIVETPEAETVAIITPIVSSTEEETTNSDTSEQKPVKQKIQTIAFGTPETHNFTLKGVEGSVVTLAYDVPEIILTNKDGETIVYKPVPLKKSCVVGKTCSKIAFNGDIKMQGNKSNSIFRGVVTVVRDYL